MGYCLLHNQGSREPHNSNSNSSHAFFMSNTKLIGNRREQESTKNDNMKKMNFKMFLIVKALFATNNVYAQQYTVDELSQCVELGKVI